MIIFDKQEQASMWSASAARSGLVRFHCNPRLGLLVHGLGAGWLVPPLGPFSTQVIQRSDIDIFQWRFVLLTVSRKHICRKNCKNVENI